ncbi:hypothetical protein ABS71_08150 [bacterium SCN 62-11]|nr:hypothetical protein [Candidatus Eremiobacteraeota bacterium]ODT71567.1 MAG: hypothetical protein ABS71_08150 [bacterium SCN 62-11]
MGINILPNQELNIQRKPKPMPKPEPNDAARQRAHAVKGERKEEVPDAARQRAEVAKNPDGARQAASAVPDHPIKRVKMMRGDRISSDKPAKLDPGAAKTVCRFQAGIAQALANHQR